MCRTTRPKLARTKVDYEKGYLTEREVLLLKNRLNGVNKAEFSHSDIPFPDDGRGFDLTPQQVEKGRYWLINQWRTPKGKTRKNNPFGYREIHVLENFETIRLIQFVNRANYVQSQYGIKAYQPYYRVVASDGSTFEYLVWGGQCEILG